MSSTSAPKPGKNRTAPTAQKAGPDTETNRPQPPDEEFWQRYSPHYEAPISGSSSIFLHLLALMVLVGFGWLAMRFSNANDISFQAVKIPGGGGGDQHGHGDAPGIGGGPVEDLKGDRQDDFPNLDALHDNPPLTAEQVKVATTMFQDPDSQRYISNNNENIARAARNLSQDFMSKVRDGLTPGQGGGGTGSGGGTGTGRGTGSGPGIGNGDGGKLSQREQRMLRWVMVFETQNPKDYVQQLAGLGAILAIPVGRDEYKVIKDLKARPATLEAEDVAKLNRIYWVDDKRQSVTGVFGVLGLRNISAPYFVAFMPQELERHLGELELAHQGLREDEIFETKFKVYRANGGYDVRVVSQTKK